MKARGKDAEGTAILRLLRDDRGATAVEYALIIAAIAATIILVVITVGEKLIEMYESANQPWQAGGS